MHAGLKSVLLSNTTIIPIVQWNFSNNVALPSWISLSATSLATMFDSSGKLTYRPNNLLTYSNTFNNAAWIKSNVTVTSGVSDPIGGTNAYTLTATASNGNIYQKIAGVSNAIATVWVRARTGTSWYLNSPNNSTPTIAISSGTWTQINTSGVGDGSYLWLSLTGGTNGDAIDVYCACLSAVTYETSPRTNDQQITTSAAYYGSRIEYNPATSSVSGLLIEESRTNACTYSNKFNGSGWYTNDLTSVTQNVAGPDGGASSAWTLVCNGSAAPAIYQSTGSSNTTITAFIKAGSCSYCFIRIADGGGATYQYFNLSTGAVGSKVGTSTASLTALTPVNVGNGWWRVGVITSGGTTFSSILYGLAANSTGSVNPSSGSTIYIYGVQVEAGGFPTSYIPTNSSSVTRSADIVSLTGQAATAIKGNFGSAIVQATDGVEQYQAVGLISNSSGSWLLYINNIIRNFNGNRTLTSSGANASNPFRAGISWTATSTTLSYNGSITASDSNSIGSQSGTVNLGVLSSSSNYLNGHIFSIAIYNNSLSVPVLKTKSTLGASY